MTAAPRPLSGKAKVAGLVGWPVSHSRSPRLHGYWLAERGIDGALVPLHEGRPSFAAWVGPDPQVTAELRAFVMGQD